MNEPIYDGQDMALAGLAQRCHEAEAERDALRAQLAQAVAENARHKRVFLEMVRHQEPLYSPSPTRR